MVHHTQLTAINHGNFACPRTRLRKSALPAFLVCVLILFAPVAPYAEFTHTVTETSVGQQVAWGKPLASGAIRSVFIAPRFTLGDVSQLAARLDLQYETVGLWSSYDIGYDPMAFPTLPDGGGRDDTLEGIRRKLDRRLDVIVLANFNTDILPEELFSTILDKVAGGVGLLIVHPRNSPESPLHLILEALEPAEETLPIWHGIGACAFPGGGGAEGLGQVLTHGDGRIVVLEYLGDPPANHCLIQAPADPLAMDVFYEDNAYSLVARALCAAANRLPDTRIAAVHDVAPTGPEADQIPPDFLPEFVEAMRDSVVAQPARPFQIALNQPADRRYNISAQLRRTDSDVRIVWHDPEVLPRGADRHQFEIPVGPGAYTVDVWLRTRSGIVDWHSTDFVLPGWPEFQNLTLEKTWLHPNDSLEISADVRPVLNHTRYGAIYARATDGYGRVVSEATTRFSHHGGNTKLRLHFSDLLSPLIRLEVYAVEGAERAFSEWELHSAYRETRYLSVRQRHSPDSLEVVVSDSAATNYNALHYWRNLANIGVGWLHAPAGEATIVHAAKQQLRLIPQVDNALPQEMRHVILREPCLTDPEFRSRNHDDIRDRTLRHWAGAFGYYSIGDGNRMNIASHRACQCRHCLIQFQRTLEQHYESVTALNDAWQQSFPAWDFVELPDDFGMGRETMAAPWVDFRRYTDNAFADYHRWARHTVTQAVPDARVGARFLSDAQPAHGYYWPALFETLDFGAMPYSTVAMARTRSYSEADSLSGVSVDNKYALDADNMYAWLPWRLAVEGLRTLWLGTPYGDRHHPAPDAWLSPDGNATHTLEILMTAVKQLRDSVGPLLYAAQQDTPTIAVYDSHASRHLADVETVYEATLSDSQQAIVDMLQLMGYSYAFVDRTALLDTASLSYPALVLPMTRALDEEEAAALYRYTTTGGALVADVFPGDCDLHGRPHNTPPLAELFGVGVADDTRVLATSLTVKDTNEETTTQAGVVRTNAAVSQTEGIPLAAAGETPAWIVNRAEEGHTFLLNHPFRPIVREHGQRLVPNEYHALARFLGDLPGTSLHEGLNDFLGTFSTLSFGEARIFVVLAEYDAPRQSIRLPLKRDDVAYNALTGERIRRPHRARFRLDAGEPLVVTVLPEPIKDIFVDIPEIVHIGAQLPIQITAQTDTSRAGKHLFVVDLMPIRGEPIPWYRRVVTTGGGMAQTYIPLSQNEVLGAYVLRVRDALTGMENTTNIRLSSPAN